MFYASLRFKKSVAIIVLSVVIAFGFLLASFINAASDLEKNADTFDERINIASVYGYDISDAEEIESHIDLSLISGDIFSDYNELQNICGFDLSDYSDKTVVRYSYIIDNGNLEIGLLCYNGRLIGGDVFVFSEGEYLSLTYENGESNGNIKD